MAPIETADVPDDASTGGSFDVLKQKLEFDISFCPRRVNGTTTLDIQPKTAQLREIILNCRQIVPTRILVEGETAAFSYSNLHQRLTLYPGTGLDQYHYARQRISRHVDERSVDELVIFVPDQAKPREVRPQEAGMPVDAQGTFYAPLKLEIEYVLDDFRDALHFVGVEDGDARFPHCYTRNSPFPGTASSLFPCLDDGSTRCLFEVSVRYPRTMGDAFSKASSPAPGASGHPLANEADKADSVMADADDDQVDLSDEEKAMEMSVICSGGLTDDIVDPSDPSRKTASFACDTMVLAQHVGFVIGPFEHVDLSEYRDTADDERLGSNAIKVHAFCLPGKEDEVRNSAMMLARSLDNFTERFQSYAFGNSYKLAFVDDLECDTAHTASFSICSSRLLFPETVWEPLEHTTRVLVHAVASQWIGVDVIAQSPYDYWIIIGGSWFMAELYLRELFGRNDWRFRQKLMVDKVTQMDHKRPSLVSLGNFLQLDPAEKEFMELKSLLVLVILHNRLVKQSGKNGVDRCLYRMLFNARQGKYTNGAINTDDFLDICEKVGHQKLDAFFKQWIEGSGCPTFECFPTFNKKKQVVQLTIKQIQADSSITTIENPLAADDFMREAKERSRQFNPKQQWPVFVGPMTIRIHEADGTPYEHIVDINSSNVKVEIPYNTKYKRLKRNKLNRERLDAAANLNAAGEAQEDVTFYMLGDLFTNAKDHEEWRLDDWPPEDEAKQEQEHYEWIRVDADFEWIAKAHINDMPSYMYISQLQQDKDVVAQAESIQFLATREGHKLISTFLIKTLMDNRYFHGIRTMAAEVMAQSAKQRTDWIGLFHLKKAFRELFCIPGSPMTRANDFSDRSLYLIQCAIPKAIAKVKGEDGKVPMEAKRFLLDIIRYNDNRGNDYSDDHYISTLMYCLAESLTSTKTGAEDSFNFAQQAEEFEFTKKAIEELTRHQRLDEWIPTYQNIYTTTALDCAMKLSMNRVIPFKPSEFLQYAQLGNADNVRLKAWECLIRLGMMRKDSVMKFMIHEIRSDPSPYFRRQLLRVFDVAIGQIATGNVFLPEKIAEHGTDALIVESDADGADRASNIARQQLDGAIKGLQSDLANNKTLRAALEEALKSKTLSVNDMSDLLDFCDIVYNSRKKNTLPITLHYPRYWKAEHVGQGKVRFWQIKKYRTHFVRPLVEEAPVSLPRDTPLQQLSSLPPPPPPAPAPVPVPVPLASIPDSAPTSTPVSTPAPIPASIPTSTPSSVPSPLVAPPKQKLSLKIATKPKSASSPPPIPSTLPGLGNQARSFSPAIRDSSVPTSVRASPVSLPPAPKIKIKTESRAPSRVPTPRVSPAPVDRPLPKAHPPATVVQKPAAPPTAAPPNSASSAPAPALASTPAAPQPKPRPTPVQLSSSLATTPAINSPIPLPAPKLKIKTKLANPSPSTASPRPSAGPSPRPLTVPSPRPNVTPSSRPNVIPPPRPSVVPPSRPSGTPVPRPSNTGLAPGLGIATPKPPRPKRSKIVKLRLAPEVLARFASKKRKVMGSATGEERPFKRQSLELGGANRNRLVRVERYGGDEPVLMVKFRIGRERLPGGRGEV